MKTEIERLTNVLRETENQDPALPQGGPENRSNESGSIQKKDEDTAL